MEIKIKPVLLKEKSDLSKCYSCNETIYGNMYKLVLIPETKSLKIKIDMVLCESCKGLIRIK